MDVDSRCTNLIHNHLNFHVYFKLSLRSSIDKIYLLDEFVAIFFVSTRYVQNYKFLFLPKKKKKKRLHRLSKNNILQVFFGFNRSHVKKHWCRVVLGFKFQSLKITLINKFNLSSCQCWIEQFLYVLVLILFNFALD